MSNTPDPLKILLVEDNQVNLLVATAVFSTQGYLIGIAENGVEGVKAVINGEYNIVLMDIQMPEMNSVEATHEIRALDGDKSAVPIIAVTAHAMHGDRETYLAAGMNDYVSKPIDPKLLLKAINRWAGQSGAASDKTACDTPDQSRDRIVNG